VRSRSLRIFVAVVCASAVTVGLLWLMQALIGVPYELLPSEPAPIVDFVRLKRDLSPEPLKRELPKLTPPQAPPPPPQMTVDNRLDPREGVEEIATTIDTSTELESATSLSSGGSDRDVVPLVQVKPQYPMRAAERGIEGWVEVRFTVSRAGTVKDPEVTAANPRSVFDDAALQAIRKWKYQPKVVNGAPVERPGVTVRLEFTLQA